MNGPTQADNLRLVREAFERWNSGDHEIDYGTLDPEVEVYGALSSTSGVPYRGHAGFRQWLADIDDQFERWEIWVDEMRELDGDRVLGFGGVRMSGRGSGVELDQPFAWLFTFRAGRLLRYQAFRDRDEALRAAGVQP
jgi:ketosteroid isomerase-like protein